MLARRVTPRDARLDQTFDGAGLGGVVGGFGEHVLRADGREVGAPDPEQGGLLRFVDAFSLQEVLALVVVFPAVFRSRVPGF